MIEGKNKQIYFESSVYKQLNIEVIGSKCVIDNSMREQDTFTLTETLNDGTELKFGSCLPNQISFTAHDIPAGQDGLFVPYSCKWPRCGKCQVWSTNHSNG